MTGPAGKWWYQRSPAPVAGRRAGPGRLIAQAMIALAVAALFVFVCHRVLFAAIVAGIGLLILVCGLWIPRLYSAFERVIGFFAFGVGQVMTWLLLVPFYYLCFLPARIILVLMKRDPMRRGWDSALPTYWEKKRSFQAKDSLLRQY